MLNKERSDAFENWFTNDEADQEEQQQQDDCEDYDDRRDDWEQQR